MAYTVNKLAKLSGVSVRALHLYDEVGLLKPAYVGENSYRYYEEEQLLMLQQILFYRELGFPLNEIKRITSSTDFDKLTALSSHKELLEQRLGQTKGLIKTIEKTISHLRGKVKMKDEELYYGFDSEKQKEYEKQLVDKGYVTQEYMNESKKTVAKLTEEQKSAFIQELEKIMLGLIEAIEKGAKPHSAEVQDLIRRHYHWLGVSWNPTKEKYLGLAELYQSPDFRTYYDKRHPKLLAFIVESMKLFADREL